MLSIFKSLFESTNNFHVYACDKGAQYENEQVEF